MEQNNRETVDIKNTRFIFPTHFNHQPDHYKGTGLYANVIVPEEQVRELVQKEIYIKQYPKVPEDGDDIVHYVKVFVNYDFWRKPVVCLIMDGKRQADVLDDATIQKIDELNQNHAIDNVNVRCNIKHNDGKANTLYVQFMDVDAHSEQTPYDEWYGGSDDDSDAPF